MSSQAQMLLQRDSLIILWEIRAVWVTILFYLLSSFYYLVWLILPGSRMGRFASRLFLAGAIVHTAIIVERTIVTAGLPYQTPYECLLWFAWSAAITHIFVEWRTGGIRAGGLPVTLIALGACLYAVLKRSPGVVPLFPALQSDWFVWHVVIAFMSYAVFAVAFAVEFGYLVLTRLRSPHLLSRYGMDAESAARFHRFAHHLVLFGFPLLTFGIISGAVWAEQAWGRYWSWDPKETWSLITWTVYALYLHAMTMGRWRGGRASALNALGFVCVLIAFLGVNWIAKLLGIPGLHAYSV